MPRVFISVGDPSGDIHAARLMQELQKLVPNIEFIGIGGENMEQCGLRSIIPISEISVVGFWEVLKKINTFRQLMTNCKTILSNEKVDLFLPIDYPGFNIKLTKFAKSQNIPVVYYIAPQLWAWGKHRAKQLQIVDKLFVVFPFEEQFFKNYGINAEFVGHPLLDNPLLQNTPTNYSERENILAILPGSRQQEIDKHIELFVRSANLFREKFNNYRIVLAKSTNANLSRYESFIKYNEIEIEENSLELMVKSKLGIIKTGTSNLEAALCGMPFTMVYKTSNLSYVISKQLIDLNFISIVNILEKRLIIDEIIQKDATPEKISNSLIKIYENSEKLSDILNSFANIRKILQKAGASKTVAQRIKDNFL
jgi:lipid-A-disaccharide synthase